MKPIFVQIMIVLIMLLVLFGCGGSEAGNSHRWSQYPLSVRIDSDLDVSVLDAYNTAFDTDIFIDSEDAPITVTLVDTIEHDPSAAGYTLIKYNKLGNIYLAHIYIRNDLSDDQYQLVLAHELGHALGLNHADSGLMVSGDIPNSPLDELLTDPEFMRSVVTQITPEISMPIM